MSMVQLLHGRRGTVFHESDNANSVEMLGPSKGTYSKNVTQWWKRRHTTCSSGMEFLYGKDEIRAISENLNPKAELVLSHFSGPYIPRSLRHGVQPQNRTRWRRLISYTEGRMSCKMYWLRMSHISAAARFLIHNSIFHKMENDKKKWRTESPSKPSTKQ